MRTAEIISLNEDSEIMRTVEIISLNEDRDWGVVAIRACKQGTGGGGGLSNIIAQHRARADSAILLHGARALFLVRNVQGVKGHFTDR